VERKGSREVFGQLVTHDGSRVAVHRADLVQGTSDPARAEAIVHAFVEARLLVSDEGSVELVHEEVTRRWDRLAGWLRVDRREHVLLQDLRTSARRWNDQGRPVGLLWSGDSLKQARSVLGKVTAEVQDFVREARTRQVRLRSGFAALGLLVLGLTAGVLVVNDIRREDTVEARAQAGEALRQLEMEDLIGRAKVSAAAGRTAEAAAYLLAAKDAGGSDKVDAEMSSVWARGGYSHVLRSEDADIETLLWCDELLVTIDSKGRLAAWDPATGDTRWTTDLKALNLHDGRRGPSDAPFIQWRDEIVVAWYEKVLFVPLADGIVRDWIDAPWRGTPTALEVSTDGRYLLAAGSRRRPVLLDTRDWSALQTEIERTPHTAFTGLAPDGNWYYVTGPGTVDLFRTDGTKITSLASTTEPGDTRRKRHMRCAFSPDSRMIAIAGDHLHVLDANGQQIARMDLGNLTAGRLTFNADSRYIIASGGALRVYDVEEGALAYSWNPNKPVSRVAVAPQGDFLAFSSGDHVELLSLRTGTILQTFTGHSSGVTGFWFSEDGTWLASISRDGTARVWTISDRRLLVDFTSNAESLARSPLEFHQVRLSHDEKWLVSDTACWSTATGQRDEGDACPANPWMGENNRHLHRTGSARGVETHEQRWVRRRAGGVDVLDGDGVVLATHDVAVRKIGSIPSIQLSQSSDLFSVGSLEEQLLVIDASDGRVVSEFDADTIMAILPPGTSNPRRPGHARLSNDGEVIAVKHPRRALVISSRTGDLLSTLEGDGVVVGRHEAAVVLMHEQRVRLLDLATRQTVTVDLGQDVLINGLTYLHDGRLAVTTQQGIVIVDREGVQHRLSDGIYTRFDQHRLTRNGRYLVAGSFETGTAGIWDIRSGILVDMFEAGADVRLWLVGPDRLLTKGRNPGHRLYRLPPEDPDFTARDLAGLTNLRFCTDTQEVKAILPYPSPDQFAVECGPAAGPAGS